MNRYAIVQLENGVFNSVCGFVEKRMEARQLVDKLNKIVDEKYSFAYISLDHEKLSIKNEDGANFTYRDCVCKFGSSDPLTWVIYFKYLDCEQEIFRFVIKDDLVEVYTPTDYKEDTNEYFYPDKPQSIFNSNGYDKDTGIYYLIVNTLDLLEEVIDQVKENTDIFFNELISQQNVNNTENN